MRDHCTIYRSFHEAISQLPKENQGEIWNAIMEYALNFNLVELTGLSKTIFILIKPQIEANIKRYESGITPKKQKEISESEAKDKQNVSEPEANNNYNINNNINIKEKEIKISTPLKKIKAELDLTIVPPDFLPAVELWLSYKKEKGKTYKPMGFEAMLSETQKEFSSGEDLMAAVKFSMSKNWDGIFREKKNGTTQKNNHHNTGAPVFSKI